MAGTSSERAYPSSAVSDEIQLSWSKLTMSRFNDNIVVVLLLAATVVLLLNSRRSKGKLPPSPPGGLPILGHVFNMPKKNGWLVMHNWAQTLGPIFHLNMAGQPVIVLSSNHAALELLERRSQIYSDRPRMVMTGELMSQGMVVGFSRFGDQYVLVPFFFASFFDASDPYRWKRFRKAAHQGINIRAAEAYYGIMEREASLLVKELHKDPDSWDDHFQRFVIDSVRCYQY